MTKSLKVAHAQPSPTPNGNFQPLQTNYFEQRLAQLGLERSDAKAHGLAEDATGAILQFCRTYEGKIRHFTPQFGRSAEKLKKMERRKTFSGFDPHQYDRPLCLTRYTPAQRAADPEKPRYKMWSSKFTGISTLPFPNQLAIQHYKDQKKGGIIAFGEGVFKGTAAAVHGLEFSAFSGNTHFQFDEVVKDYIEQREPDHIVLMLDGDAQDLHGKKVELTTRRIQSFYTGIYKFAAAFLDWAKRNKIKTQLHLAIIQKGQPKGLDDLFQDTTPEQQAAIVEAYQSLTTSEYFAFTRLTKSTFKKKLQQLFYLDNHQHFYDQFAEEIGTQPFKFNGFWYQCIDPLPIKQQLSLLENKRLPAPLRRQFKLLEDPFQMEVPTTPLTIKQYLSSAYPQIKTLLQEHALLAFESPTGSGKTSFFIKYLQQTKQRAVITVPTVNLARQLAHKHKICALYGKATLSKKTIALNVPIVVCTYDTLHHLDLQRRWLIVDEAHNLVNQFGQVRRSFVPFRATTLRTVVDKFGEADKTILLSGTMNTALCKAFNFHLVKIKRHKNNQINIQQLEAMSTGEQTALLLSELRKIDYQTDKIHFVYYNNNQQLQLVKKHLLETGLLVEKDIAIITRDEVNAGQQRIFNEIIQLERIKSPVKLILSTCLIAEGINIQNRNIGKVFTVNVRCLDSFRQYVARFRRMKKLEVFCITPPERKLHPTFAIPAESDLTSTLECAALQLQQCQLHKQRILNTYDPDELEFMPELLADYQINGQLLNWIYEDGEDQKVDVLRILASIRDRQIETSNNCYFFSRLRQFPEFRITQRSNPAAQSSIQDDLKKDKKQMKQLKKETLEQLKTDLLSDPKVPIYAYYLHAKQTQNSHAKLFLERSAPDLIEQPVTGAADYLKQHQTFFAETWFKQPIRDYVKMHFAGVDQTTIAEELEDYSPRHFAQKWRGFITTVELRCYENKRWRKHMSPLHRLELKFLNRIKKKVITKSENGSITSTLLQREINAMLQRLRYDTDLEHPIIEQFAHLTPKEIETRLLKLFKVERSTFANHYEYKILLDYTDAIATKRNLEEVPFCNHSLPKLLEKPLQVLKLYGA